MLTALWRGVVVVVGAMLFTFPPGGQTAEDVRAAAICRTGNRGSAGSAP